MGLGPPMAGKTFPRRTLIVLLLFSGILLYVLTKYTTLFDVYPDYRVLDAGEYAQLTETRRAAYNDALACSGIRNPELTFTQIRWELVPGNMIRFPVIEGRVLELRGWFNPRDSTIYIPFTERGTRWILVHESLHALGYRGHPSHPFRTCNVMTDQNP